LFLKPKWAEAHYNLGRAFSMQGRSVEAAAQFRQAIRVKPAYVAAHTNLAMALHELGNISEALACARRALAIHVTDADAFNVLGTCLLALGRTEEAIGCFRRAAAARPEDVALHSNLIFALNFCPKATTADQQLERVTWARRHASSFYPQPQPNVVRHSGEAS